MHAHTARTARTHAHAQPAGGACRAGRVREGTERGKKIAIKHIARVFQVKEDAIRIIRELRFLRVLKHPNVRPTPPPRLASHATSADDARVQPTGVCARVVRRGERALSCPACRAL